MKVSKQNIMNLLSSVSSDGRGAFEHFYNLYYDQVFRFAYYCLGEKEACKGVVSDVFFSIWKSKARLKEIDNIDTYLYITVRNEALRHISRSNSVNKIQMDQLCSFEPEEEATPEGMLESQEMRELLNLAIDELPEKCRLIFLMIREEGLSTKEVAKILSIQESTVRVQMKIAVEKLIKRLKSDFPDISFVFILISIFQ
mgnify:FL=1